VKNYISILNKIKKEFSYNWLTDSQIEVFERIRDYLSYPGSVTGFLYGISGSGKTFTGWMLEKEKLLEYIPDGPKEKYELSSSIKGVVIDNIDWNRYTLRNIIKDLALSNINRYLLIGKYAPDEKLLKEFPLNLTEEDIIKVKENIKNIGFILPDNSGSTISLWNIFRR